MGTVHVIACMSLDGAADVGLSYLCLLRRMSQVCNNHASQERQEVGEEREVG